VAFGSGELVVIVSVPVGAMVSVKVADALAGVDSESVTVAVTVKFPVWQVLPEMVALGVPDVNASPVGSPVIVQE
jgi:hypothetical protein